MPSRSSARSPRSRSSRSTATRSTWAAGCTDLRRRRSSTSRSTPRIVNLTEAALLAGLPKGPAAYSPILNPDKALRRRNLVLSEMESDGVITHAQADKARQAPLGLHIAQPRGLGRALVPGGGAARAGEALRHRRGARGRACAWTPLSTSTCSRPPTARCWTGWPPTSAATAGGAHPERAARTASASRTTSIPTGRLAYHAGDYVHAVVTRVLPLEVDARFGPEQVVLLGGDWTWTGAALRRRAS